MMVTKIEARVIDVDELNVTLECLIDDFNEIEERKFNKQLFENLNLNLYAPILIIIIEETNSITFKFEQSFNKDAFKIIDDEIEKHWNSDFWKNYPNNVDYLS